MERVGRRLRHRSRRQRSHRFVYRTPYWRWRRKATWCSRLLLVSRLLWSSNVDLTEAARRSSRLLGAASIDQTKPARRICRSSSLVWSYK